jgi:hypothetical protein
MAKSKQQQQQGGLLSLFDDPEPAMPTAHIPGFEKMAPETQDALCTMVKAVWTAADRVAAAYCFYCGKKPPHGVDLPEGWAWDTFEPDNVACFCPDCDPTAREALREATERSRAMREDLVGIGGSSAPFDFDERPVTGASTAPCDQPGFWANKLKEMGEMRLLAARSFIEFARRSGMEHEALTPTGTDSNGQKTYDFGAITRLANKARGRPESTRPELKTEADWQEAIEGVKLWKLVQKADQLVKDGKIPSR